MSKIIIFDTETTGFPKKFAPIEQQPHIIELGAMFIEDGEVAAELSQLIQPNVPIPVKITEITGITNADLVGMPLFGEYFHQLKNFFTGADMLIAHNAPFDVKMLGIEVERYNNSLRGMAQTKPFEIPMPAKVVCTIQEYKSMFGKWMKMTALYERIVGKPLMQTHRALDDCRALHEILTKDGFYDSI